MEESVECRKPTEEMISWRREGGITGGKKKTQALQNGAPSTATVLGWGYQRPWWTAVLERLLWAGKDTGPGWRV